MKVYILVCAPPTDESSYIVSGHSTIGKAERALWEQQAEAPGDSYYYIEEVEVE